MCVSCAATPTFNPECIFSGEVNEGVGDWGETSATAGSMSVGGTVTGDLTIGDRDWIAIDFVAGETYTISLSGSGSSPVSDTYLRLWDEGSTSASSGVLVAQDDDSGTGLNSQITFTASTSGTFYISAGSYNDNRAGQYTVSVNQTTPEPPATMDEIADHLVNGYWEETGRVARMWNVGSDNEITYNATSMSAGYQAYAETAFQTWTDLTGIEFVAVSGSAEITFQDTELGSAYSSSTTNSAGNIITSNLINVGSDWENLAGADYTLQTFIHEIGHSLGLGHAGTYNGNATYGVDERFSNDSWQASIMSYFSQSENTSVDASFAYLLTPMLADAIAIQSIYGSSVTTRSGDTVYGYNSNAGQLYDLDGITTSFNYALTVYDSGGIDTFDLSGSTANVTLNLASEGISSILGETGNLIISRGVVIENAIGGSGNDSIVGNGANNHLEGGAGGDELFGGQGNDILEGGSGADEIYGGAGIDRADYTTSSTAVRVDMITGVNTGDADGDELNSIENLYGSNFNDVLLGTNDANVIWGGNGNDKIYGRYGADTLAGGIGNDTLVGGFGADTLLGGAGIDIAMYSDSGAGITIDLITEVNTGIASGDTYDSIENVFGSNFNDIIRGDNGSNVLWGANGNDDLFGRFGNDTLIGGNGQDVLFGGAGADLLSGGADIDIASYADSASGVRVDMITGTNSGFASGDTFVSIEGLEGSNANDVLLGDNASNILYGLDGADRLYGRYGNDTLEGGSDNDQMWGGAGRDTFVFSDGDGQDIIQDFDATDGDYIDLSGNSAWDSFTALNAAGAISQAPGGVYINLSNTDYIFLKDVSIADIDASDFIF